MANEVEIKFAVHDLDGTRKRLSEIGFKEVTPRTHELNTLYDHLGKLRSRGEVLRIRKYGEIWKVTHKSKGAAAKHKTRAELETKVQDGETLDQIAARTGVAGDRIAAASGLSIASVGPGDVLLIPDQSAAAQGK